MDLLHSPTLLRHLAIERHCQVYETFSKIFDQNVADIAEEDDDPRFLQVTVSKRQLERWLSGTLKTRPRPNQCRVLEKMFGRSIDELLQPPAVQVETPSNKPALFMASHNLLFGSEIKPSQNVHLSDHQLSEVSYEMAAQMKTSAGNSRKFAADYDFSGIGQDTLESLFLDVRSLVRAYPREPLSNVMSDLVSTQELIFHLLDARLRPSQSRDLFFFAAVVTGILAKASHDMGDPRSAMAHSRAAMVCADNADHLPLKAWIFGMQSLVTFWAGDHKSSIYFAQQGASLLKTSKGHGSVAAWLPSLEARAHGSLGDGNSTDKAIQRAEAARELYQRDDLDILGGSLMFSTPRQLYYAAEADVLSNRDNKASLLKAQNAVDAYKAADPDEWAYADEAGARSVLALAHARTGDISATEEVIRPVLDIGSGSRINGIVRSIRRVDNALADLRTNRSTPTLHLHEEMRLFLPISNNLSET